MGVFIALFLLAGLAIVITGPVNDKVNDADQLSLNRDQAQKDERAQRDLQRAQRAGKRELEETRQQALSMESSLDQLQQNNDSLVNSLTALIEGTSRFGVELSGVAPDEGGGQLAGNADSCNEVFAYHQDLQASVFFEEAAILQLSGSCESTVHFSILASVPQPMDEEEQGEEEQP